VKVVRSGKTDLVHISELTVGDVVHLEAGDSAPCDGVVITNHGIKCDESSTTGESDQVEKVSGTEAWDSLSSGGQSEELDPFIISGSKVLEGLGTYLVTSVGTHSTYGKILSALGSDSEPTPLQVKLGRLANWIGWFGLRYARLTDILIKARR
jgi:Ca2+-transporting ATPase